MNKQVEVRYKVFCFKTNNHNYVKKWYYDIRQSFLFLSPVGFLVAVSEIRNRKMRKTKRKSFNPILYF